MRSVFSTAVSTGITHAGVFIDATGVYVFDALTFVAVEVAPHRLGPDDCNNGRPPAATLQDAAAGGPPGERLDLFRRLGLGQWRDQLRELRRHEQLNHIGTHHRKPQ